MYILFERLNIIFVVIVISMWCGVDTYRVQVQGKKRNEQLQAYFLITVYFENY